MFNVYAYRLFNEIATHKALSGGDVISLGSFDAEEAATLLLERQREGAKVFRPAWQIAGTGLHGEGTKVRAYCQAVADIQPEIPRIARALEQTDHIG